MKKLFLFSVLLVAYNSLLAQPGKPGTKPPPKVIKPKPLLKTLDDSASYAIGLSIAGFCKQQGLATPNMELISRSFTDVFENKPVFASEAACNDIINKLLMRGRGGAGKPDSLLASPASLDSASYAIGSNHALFFKQQGITALDTVYIVRAARDVLGNKPLQFDDRTANNVMNSLIIRLQEDKVRPAIEAGRAFLVKNKKNPKIKTTKSGLQYEVVRQGTGIRPTKVDTFVCHYKGTLIDGTEVDNSYKRDQPLVLPVTSVIRGWTEGLQLMPVGSKYMFYIPYELGYGAFGSPPAIPGGSVLIFQVELLNVKKGKAATMPVKPVK